MSILEKQLQLKSERSLSAHDLLANALKVPAQELYETLRSLVARVLAGEDLAAEQSAQLGILYKAMRMRKDAGEAFWTNPGQPPMSLVGFPIDRTQLLPS